MKTLIRGFVGLWLCCLAWVSVSAQTQILFPDYALVSVNVSPETTADEVVIEAIVTNQGALATEESTLSLSLATNPAAVLASVPVQPLAQLETQTYTVRFMRSLLPAQTTAITLQASVGLGDVEPTGITTTANNTMLVEIPPTATPVEVVPVTPPQVIETPFGSFEIPFGINLNNRIHVVGLVLACGFALVIFWLLTVIIRLLWRREPTMSAWHPPYNTTAIFNPNSPQGVRQLWQQHAQSDTLPEPCANGDFMARKGLMSMDSVKLKNWRVTGIRISQYDQYGRVARTQNVAVKGVVKQLDRIVQKSAKLDHAKAEKQVRPVAKKLLKPLFGKIKRTETLPVSLDIRFKGTHGEVRVFFEIYQCTNYRWMRVDHWEPEINIPSGVIDENFTYALFGRRVNETSKQFKQRLTVDLTQLLTQLVEKAAPPAPVVPNPPPTQPPASPPPVTDVNNPSAYDTARFTQL